jgi:hypothetical protein
MENCYGPRHKLLISWGSLSKPYRVLSKVVSFPLSESDVQYALKCKQFTTLSKLFAITMNPAWDRLCREQAHAI